MEDNFEQICKLNYDYGAKFVYDYDYGNKIHKMFLHHCSETISEYLLELLSGF